MSTHDIVDAVAALVGAVCFLLAAGFAVRGWLVNLPDGSVRSRWRVSSFVALLIGEWLIYVADDNLPWWRTVIWVLFAACLILRLQHHWRQLEAYRRIERLTAARQHPAGKRIGQ